MGIGQSMELSSDYNFLLREYKSCLESTHINRQTCTCNIIAGINGLDIYYAPFATNTAPFLKMKYKKVMAYRDLLVNDIGSKAP